MMDETGRKKSPYKGLFLTCLVLTIVPMLFYGLMYLVITHSDKTMNHEMQTYSAMMFGFGCGSIYHIICLLNGTLKEDFSAVVLRIKNFFSNLFVSPKLALICYKNDLKEYGVAFWPPFIIMVVFFCLFAVGFKECYQFYLNY